MKLRSGRGSLQNWGEKLTTLGLKVGGKLDNSIMMLKLENGGENWGAFIVGERYKLTKICMYRFAV